MAEQLTLDLGMGLRSWGTVRVGDVVPQRQTYWHPEHGISHGQIRMRVTRIDNRGDGVLGVEMVGLTGQIHGRYSHYRTDAAVTS